MSDYIREERKVSQVFRSFFAVLLAFAVAFTFSGVSAVQYAFAEAVSYTAKYAGMDPEPNPAEETLETEEDSTINLESFKDKFPGYELKSTTVGEGDPNTDVNSNITVNENDTVTFTYEAIEYDITYYGMDGATNPSSNPEKYTIETNDITLSNPERDGYDFAGWTYDGQTTPNKDVTISKGSTGNLAYTANWTLVNYDITYTLGDDAVAGTPANPATYTIETNDITLSNPERDGYDFAGWTGTGLDEATEKVIIEKGSTGNREYTATWTPKTTVPDVNINYTVKYVNNANETLDTKNLTTKTTTVTIGPDTIKAPDGYSVSGITVTTGDNTDTVTSFGPGGTFTVAEGSIVTVTCTPVPVEKTVSYTVKYVGLATAQQDYTRTETVEDDAEAVIAIWEEDINKTFEGYKIVSVKLDNGTTVAAGEEVASGSVITVTYEKIPAQKTGAWVQSGSRWWYKYSDGTWPANEWLNDNGKYYHFDSAGWMQTGWLSTNKGVNNNALDAATWFYLDGSGSAHTGWLLLGNTWYYLNTSADVEGTNLLATMVGAPTQGALTVTTVKGKEYCFAYSGAMQTGWKKINNTWFYFDASGAQVENGWAMSGGKWFWLSSDGSMATSSWVDGNNYYVGGDGAMLTGWFKVDSTWFYANASGKKLVNQWLLSGGKWYWLNADGSMAESAWVDNGKYYVTTGGAMVTGWNRIGTNSAGDPTLDAEGDHAWYYFNASGLKTVNAWVKSGGKWYWLTDDGTMAENEWVDKGNYYMGADGVMETGWKRISVNGEGQTTIDKQGRPSYYYFNESGLKMTNTWVARDGNDYWLGKDGAVVQGQWVDNGKYYVNDEGVYVPNYKADPDSENN